ncbi:hypothetical protein [Streptomyces sp. CA-111067]|uniref:hypothetical protein n=1 Tax=Streptomyces sp. CA-111067 TaxID=3240046 RepID=UPI003D97F092
MLLGDWAGGARVVGVPAAVVLVVAGMLGAAAGGSALDPGGTGWWARSRAALALLVLGFGGHLRIVQPMSENSGFASDGGPLLLTGNSTSGLALVPLTVTLFGIGALVLGLRAMRRRHQTGPEAAVRVAVLATAAATALALLGQVSVHDDHAHTSAGRVALWTFLVSLVTALAVLRGPGRAAWLAARPQLVTAWRVLRTALLALVATVLFAGVVVFFVALDHYDELGGWGVIAALFVLPNLGVSGLALGWGAPVDSSSGGYGGPTYHDSYGLTDLGGVADGWAAIGAVAGGLLCALLIGVIAVRHCRDRAEQFGVAAAFSVLLVGLTAIGGLAMNSKYPFAALSGTHTSVGSDVAMTLLVSLLWSVGGVAAGPYVARALYRSGLFGAQAPYAAQGPYAAPGTYPGPNPPQGANTAQTATAQGPYTAQTPTPQGPYPPRSPFAPPPLPGSGGAAPVPPQPSAPPAVPAAPAEPPVHDLGIVQPDRLREQPPKHH